MNRFIRSPCDHGYLVDVIPYGEEDCTRWGIQTVVLRDERAQHKPGEVVPCCSYMEGEFETREQAQRECDHQKKWYSRRLLEALATLDRFRDEVWALAHVRLEDLIRYHELVSEQTQTTGGHCEVPLCFEAGTWVWVEKEQDSQYLCKEHAHQADPNESSRCTKVEGPPYGRRCERDLGHEVDCVFDSVAGRREQPSEAPPYTLGDSGYCLGMEDQP